MRRVTLTGAPGAGKTMIIDELAERGYRVEPEAATPLIEELQLAGDAEPWHRSDFPELIAQRQLRALQRPTAALEIHDRSPVCTLALARYLGHPTGPSLRQAVELSRAEFVPIALLIEPIGTIERTAVRAMSYEMSLEFEQVHIQTYEDCGFDLVRIAPGSVSERTDSVVKALGRCARS